MYENLLNSNEVYYIASFVFFKELFLEWFGTESGAGLLGNMNIMKMTPGA